MLTEGLDFGSVTVLFNQLGGLQVINPKSQEWKYVKPQPGSAIINLGDALVKLVGDRLYSGVHRVVGDSSQVPLDAPPISLTESRPTGRPSTITSPLSCLFFSSQ